MTVRLDWELGGDAWSIGQLAQFFAENVIRAIPEPVDITYDLGRGRFLRRGRPISDAQIEKLIEGSDPLHASGVGLATAKRGLSRDPRFSDIKTRKEWITLYYHDLDAQIKD